MLASRPLNSRRTDPMAKKTEGPETTGKRNGDGKPAAEARPQPRAKAPRR